MSKRITCRKLGIKNCNFSASGETAGDVVRDVVDHLQAEHGLDMPKAKTILDGKMREDPLDLVDPAVKLIVERLVDDLNIESSEGTSTPKPPSIGRVPSR